LQPPQAAAILSERLKVINKINADIADWLHVYLNPMSLRQMSECQAYQLCRSGDDWKRYTYKVSGDLRKGHNRMQVPRWGKINERVMYSLSEANRHQDFPSSMAANYLGHRIACPIP